LTAIVIGILMNDDGMADDFINPEAVREKAHEGPAVVGKERWEITGVISMRLPGWIPVFAGALKRIGWVAGSARVGFMNVKPMRADGRLVPAGWPVRRESGDVY
jgi:hypothetical protein